MNAIVDNRLMMDIVGLEEDRHRRSSEEVASSV